MEYYGLSSTWGCWGEDLGYTQPLGGPPLVILIILRPLLWRLGRCTRRVIVLIFVLATFFLLKITCRHTPTFTSFCLGWTQFHHNSIPNRHVVIHIGGLGPPVGGGGEVCLFIKGLYFPLFIFIYWYFKNNNGWCMCLLRIDITIHVDHLMKHDIG